MKQLIYWLNIFNFVTLLVATGLTIYSFLGQTLQIANAAITASFGRFSGRIAKVLSDHDINSHVPERFLQPVLDEVYEASMTNIDHQISGTKGKVERICLIRNKVMFAAGRQLRLSEGKLAYLTLEQLRALAPDVVKLNFIESHITYKNSCL